MNRVLVGEPGVSAFLRSVRRNLGGHISRMELFLLSDASPNYYDPRQDLEKLKEKLLFFQDLLVDGEARRLGEESVDEWMDDTKHLLYDVEDILDDMKSLTDHQVRVDELYIISIELKNGLGNILARTEVLRTRVKDLELKRGTGYAFSGVSKVTLRTPETSSVVDICEIHGREDDKSNILTRLLKVNAKRKKNYDVLCIVGMGGLGKTTLAQLVFNDLEVQKHFNVTSWVCISNVFDVAKATKELIENSGGDCRDHQSLAGLQRRLKETVANKRFLFVLDDVWSSSEWETMKGPFSSCANGSKILVTTRNMNIANALGNKDPYHLHGLDHKQCMEIFRDKAFVDNEDEQEKLFLGEKIVAACGGVPLVVKVVGSMLQVAHVEKWRVVSENTVNWADNHDEIHPAIRFSYYDMPASLKRCFEYLAVFPPDYEFKQNDVVCLWIAEGLVEDVEGRRVEDIGNEYYNELKARSLIQENDMMHDIVHHLASRVSRKFCYKENSKVPRASVRHAFLFKLNKMHYEFLAQAPCLRTLIVEGLFGPYLQDRILSLKMLRTLELHSRYGGSLEGRFLRHLKHMRYLTIRAPDDKLHADSLCMMDNLQFLNLHNNVHENLLNGIMHRSNLRSLELSDNSITSLPQSMIGAPSQLQVLNLYGCRKLKQLPKDVGNARSLRTLNLYRCENLKQLPKDIGNLVSLQTLDLRNTSISTLPDTICALNQVQRLDLNGCENLKQLPKDIGNLGSLQTLDLGNTSISTLPDSICALNQLETLNLENCDHLKELPKDIGNLGRLQVLCLSKTSISTLPDSICALNQLETLSLESCCYLKELPKDIGNLRSLKELYLRGTFYLSVPESILNCTRLENLKVDKDYPLSLHIESIARLEELAIHPIDRLREQVAISMEEIGGIEEAKIANLKFKKFKGLEFWWREPGNDEEMEVKIMEALEPHHALESLKFSNYPGDKFPAWIMSSNICLSNLVELKMKGFNKICEMIDMEFVSLKTLFIMNCPILRKVLMATPKLKELTVMKCGELEANSVHLLPSLSDKAGLHSTVLGLEELCCDYNIFEYFFEKLKTANSKWDNLWYLSLSGGGRRVASLPERWPSLLKSLEVISIDDIGPGKFQFVPDGDRSTFPPSLVDLYINNCMIEERLPHHWYTIMIGNRVITAGGEVRAEEETSDEEEVEQSDGESGAE